MEYSQQSICYLNELNPQWALAVPRESDRGFGRFPGKYRDPRTHEEDYTEFSRKCWELRFENMPGSSPKKPFVEATAILTVFGGNNILRLFNGTSGYKERTSYVQRACVQDIKIGHYFFIWAS